MKIPKPIPLEIAKDGKIEINSIIPTHGKLKSTNSISEWVDIISVNDDEIERDILEWAELTDLWDGNEAILSHFGMVSDILEHCLNACVVEENWDAGFPGRSGVNYTVSTNDAELLKIELKERILKLIIPKPITPTTPLIIKSPSTIKELIDYLMSEAYQEQHVCVRNIYGGYGKYHARLLEEAANKIENRNFKSNEIYSLIETLAATISNSRIRSNLLDILENINTM